MAQSVGAVALDIVMGKNTVSGVAKSAIEDIKRTFNDGSSTISSKASAIGSACTQIGSALLPVSIGAQAVIKSTVDAAMSFEEAMAQVQTIAGDASVSYQGDMMSMSDAIKQLSTDTGIAAEEVALATYNAISAGVDTANSVEFVATANALAVGGFSDMTTAVDVLTTTLNAYGDKAGTAESISDKLITTQNLGKTTVNELASSIGKVIPTASAYGISIDNLCASYVAMTKGGIATAESTTYMKSMFNELADSGSNVGKILQEQTGKSFGQLMEEGNSLADVITILGDSVNGDSEAFAQLWGSSEAGTGALAILNGGVDDFNTTLKEMGNSTGAASDAMAKMNETDAHKMQVAMNDMKNAAIDLGVAFAPVMTTIADTVSAVAKAFSALPDPVKNVIAVILLVAAVVAPLLIGVGGLISGIGTLVTMFGAISGAMAYVIPIVAGVVAVVGLLVGAFVTAWKNSEEFRNKVTSCIKAIKDKWEEFSQKFLEKINSLGFEFENFGDLIKGVWEMITEWLVPNLEAFFGMLELVVTTGLDVVLGVVDIFVGIFKGDWEQVFEGVKTIAKSFFDFIKGMFIGQLNFIKDKVNVFLNWNKTSWSDIWNNIKTTVSNIFTGIKTNISNIITGIKTFVSNAWNAIKSTVSNILNAISNTVSNIWNRIKTTVSNVMSSIRTTVSNIWTSIKTGVSTAVNGVYNAVKTGFTKAVNYIKGLASSAYTWGKDMIDGIARGIRDSISKVTGAVKGVADKIRANLHFSRPDEGSLRDYETWMPDFIDGMTRGINDNKYKLINAVKGMAGEMVMPGISAPQLKNVGNAGTVQTSTSADDRLYGLLAQLINKIDNSNMGDITIPVYLGNDLIDEQILRASDRRTLRSGGRA